MRLASLIHHSCVQIPPRSGLGIHRARSSSESILFAAVALRHTASSSPSSGMLPALFSAVLLIRTNPSKFEVSCIYFFLGIVSEGICYSVKHLSRMQCFSEKNHEGLEFAEEMHTADPQSHEGNKVKEATSDASVNHQTISINSNSSLRTVTLCVLAAATFGLALGLKDGPGKASEYFAGYILEQSLSVDNLFVFVLIFKYFKVPAEYQGRVLSYGITGAIIFRAIIILLGIATIQLFSADGEETDLSDNFIVRTCQKFIPVTAYYDGDRFLTSEDGVWKATPLLLTIAVIELSDIAFAIDSIPAVFGVTRDPFIVFSSNIFAISGLRSLYALISESMSELEYLQEHAEKLETNDVEKSSPLQPAIGIVLGFIGAKMIFEFIGYHISTEVSLGFVAAILSTSVILSLLKRTSSEE
ncbi:hypothetical protein AXF42_Ash021089 [Apostasia shenzhenica]|uniref:Thylakoid membrane protein TERC, chloroplastic n=1 Tax=Apostasia shenzhenica TaxID=1088818 RepID=A0A2H9ZXW9_9ASPA|nr:hypothetical protein AXF42_Ash021089 [Apostasia shenzhenica]